MRNRILAALLVGMATWAVHSIAADPPLAVKDPGSDSVQFTIRICEGKDKLKFWFNDEAKERWNTCSLPVPDVPVFIVSESGQRVEGTTGKDGIANVPKLTLRPNETFRMAMACTTHNCFSLRGLFVGAPDIASGANTMYAETIVTPAGRNSNGVPSNMRVNPSHSVVPALEQGSTRRAIGRAGYCYRWAVV